MLFTLFVYLRENPNISGISLNKKFTKKKEWGSTLLTILKNLIFLSYFYVQLSFYQL